MKQDKYCEICGRKVARLYHLTLNSYFNIEYEACSECIDAVKSYIEKRYEQR